MLQQAWQYLIGPIVAEALNHPATWNGVEAVAGYNLFNTFAWALLALSMVLTAGKLFEAKNIQLSPEHAVEILPIIFMGGLLRFAQDSLDLNFYIEILLITPIIYVWMGAVAAAFIYINSSRDIRKPFYAVLGLASIPVLYSLPGINWLPALAIITASLVIGAAYSYISQGTKFDSRPLVLMVSSQFFEAFSSMYAFTQGFQPRQLLTSASVNLLGPAGFLALKMSILAAAFHVYFDLETEWKSLLLIALYSIGFATGLRVFFRALTGV